jgi:SAM-dependent methyltransferase
MVSGAVSDAVSTEERLCAALDSGAADIGVLWEFCAYFEWHDRASTVDGIRQWLGAPDGQRILDCACGSGFPALELTRLGYDVTCSDGSEAMIEHFRRNALREGVDVPVSQLRWEELGEHHGSSFDVVLCRGAAFPYAGTWDADSAPDRRLLSVSLRQFVACLRPGGRLYLDIPHASDVARRRPRHVRHPRLAVGGHTIDLEETVTNDPERRIRRWETRLTVDGRTSTFERRSHLLWPHELKSLFREAGLTDIRRESVRGEHYQVYSGILPADACD